MPSTNLTEQDEGKRIVTSDGNELGEIMAVRDGIPYIDPDPDMAKHLKGKFDVGDVDEESYPLETADVAEVTDGEVRLR